MRDGKVFDLLWMGMMRLKLLAEKPHPLVRLWVGTINVLAEFDAKKTKPPKGGFFLSAGAVRSPDLGIYPPDAGKSIAH